MTDWALHRRMQEATIEAAEAKRRAEDLEGLIAASIEVSEVPLYRRIGNQRRELKCLNTWNAMLHRWHVIDREEIAALKASIRELEGQA